LITGYAKQGQGERALQCFEQMRRDNLSPDAITFLGVLKACGSKGAVDKGIQIHDEITSIESLKTHIDLGNALVDMYAKCGQLEKAQEVFNELLVRDVVSWNVLISGYGQEGEGEKALFYFEKMQCDGISPDAVTLLCVLSACSHSGMVEEGRKCFADITEKHGFAPDIQHKTCMVDLFSRAGLFDNAMKMIKEMAVIDYPLWCCVLDACQRWGNVQLGRLAFEEAIRLDSNDAAAYISMASIYMAAGLQEEAKKIEAMRMRNCVCHTAT
jgi:pentatricopeptide repeat protein